MINHCNLLKKRKIFSGRLKCLATEENARSADIKEFAYIHFACQVSSLWHVDDPATKELMVTFYRNMLEKNLDKAEALRQAKLEMLKNEKYSSPLFWSAFVMYGE